MVTATRNQGRRIKKGKSKKGKRLHVWPSGVNGGGAAVVAELRWLFCFRFRFSIFNFLFLFFFKWGEGAHIRENMLGNVVYAFSQGPCATYFVRGFSIIQKEKVLINRTIQ